MSNSGGLQWPTAIRLGDVDVVLSDSAWWHQGGDCVVNLASQLLHLQPATNAILRRAGGSQLQRALKQQGIVQLAYRHVTSRSDHMPFSHVVHVLSSTLATDEAEDYAMILRTALKQADVLTCVEVLLPPVRGRHAPLTVVQLALVAENLTVYLRRRLLKHVRRVTFTLGCKVELETFRLALLSVSTGCATSDAAGLPSRCHGNASCGQLKRIASEEEMVCESDATIAERRYPLRERKKPARLQFVSF